MNYPNFSYFFKYLLMNIFGFLRFFQGPFEEENSIKDPLIRHQKFSIELFTLPPDKKWWIFKKIIFKDFFVFFFEEIVLKIS